MAKKRMRVTENKTDLVLRDSILDEILNVPAQEERTISLAPVEQVVPNPYQTRKNFDQTRLDELAISMRANGFLGSLVAREREGRYQLAYGERRLRAAKIAGIAQIPVSVADFSDLQMMEVSVTENVNREDLTAIEEAEAYKLLSDAGYSYRKISERVGKSAGHISQLLSLLRIDDIRMAVEHDRIRVTEAYELSKVEDPERRMLLINQVAAGQLDRASLKEAVRRANEAPRKQSIAPPPDEVLIPGHIYDPSSKLMAAARQMRNIRYDLFEDIPIQRRSDMLKLLEEIASRAKAYITVLEEIPDEGIDGG